MELSQNDSLFKMWPSAEEIAVSRPTNKYGPLFNGYNRKEEDRVSEAIECGTAYARFMLNTQLPIHTFLYIIVERSLVLESEKYSPYKTFFMDDEALVLSIMLKRDGFLDNANCDKPCVACATEKLETEMNDLMRRQMEILYLARKFYTQPENEDKYNICLNHRQPNINTYYPNNDITLAPQCTNSYNWLEETMQARRHNIEIIQRIIMQTQNNIMRFPILCRIPSNISNYANIAGYQSNFNYLNQTDMQQNQFDQSYLQNYLDSYFQNFNSTPEPNRCLPRQSKFFPEQTQHINDTDFLPNYIFVPGSSCENSFPRQELSNSVYLQNNPFNYAADVSSIAQTSNYLNNRCIKAPPGFAPNNVPISINQASNLLANQIIEENYLLNTTNHSNIAPFQPSNTFMRNNTNMSNINIPAVSEDTPVRGNRNAVTNTVNRITREYEQLRGNRVGRKIVGKRY